MLSTWTIAPALATGCTVLHKPAEVSPLTARLLVQDSIHGDVCARIARGRRRSRWVIRWTLGRGSAR